MKYDLGFGNSVAVRQAFLDTYEGNMIVFTDDKLRKFDYPPYDGDPEVIEITKQVIKRQTGNTYKHVIMTNGATGAINIALNVYRMLGKTHCVTRNPPYYLRYPTMVKASGLTHMTPNISDHWFGNDQSVILLDFPSNPLNLTSTIDFPNVPVILDGVYLNNIYTNGNIKTPKHDIFISSYSKLTGINGLRIGYLATNDDLLYEKLKEYTIAAYCGLAVSDSQMLKTLLWNFNWDLFEAKAKFSLNRNREEWAKLEKFFGTPVEEMGMFYYTEIDKHLEELLNRSGVKWSKGETLGTSNKFARFNLGQDNKIVREAVQEILKNDKL